ncbi:MAG: GNAT family N-acetyltransferase [Leptolyngbya sp. SIO1D8]|nr:GNAT family N-acetyltransferase [Leptolyngbya sp. SIO1D8]
MVLDNIFFQVANLEDVEALEAIRLKAFKPIFESFRNILGDAIYETAQMPEDIAQQDLLRSYFEEESVWITWKVIFQSQIIGFIAIRLDEQSGVGEIGLNAIDPSFSGKGIGTKMYKFAIGEMKHSGMKVATAATGGDPAHLPAREAYRKAGFTVRIPTVWMCQELGE